MSNSTGQRENLRGGKGNFANDPQRASEAGRKGGQNSHSRSDSNSRHASSGSSSSQSRNRSSSRENMEDEEG